jgi:hypothetical protein
MPRKWKDVELALLGTMSDDDVALIIGRYAESVRTRRRLLNLPERSSSHEQHVYAVRCSRMRDARSFTRLRACHQRDQRLKKHRHLLGSMPDGDLAAICKVTRHELAAYRRYCGVSKYVPPVPIFVGYCEVCGCRLVIIGPTSVARVCSSPSCKAIYRRRARQQTTVRQVHREFRILEKMHATSRS